MQQPITRRDVYEPSLTARIGGRAVELESASMDRMLPDPVSGGSLTAASGELVTVEGRDVTEHVATPWDPGSQWPPVPQTAASVDMDTGSGPVSLLRNGRVVSASGGTSGREVAVEVSDAYRSLDRSISWDAVAAHMPSLEEAELGRYVGMTTTSITNQILEHCGWYATPPTPGYTMLRVPAQGSMWPDRGHVTDCMNMGRTGYVRWLGSQWGVAAADVDASYRLAGAGYSIASRGGVELAAMTQTGGESTSGHMYLDAMSENWATRVRLQWNDSQVFLRFWDGSSWQNAVVLSRVNGLAYGTLRYVSGTRVEFTLRNGGRVSSSIVTVPSVVTSGVFASARIWGNGRGGGFLFCAPSTLGTLSSWNPNAVLYPRSANRNALAVRPPVEGENCAELLQQQCEAEAATYWIDETGVLRWWDLVRLESRQSVGTLNSDDDIAEGGFTWDHSLASVKSGVEVKWREPLQHRSWRTNVDLHHGGGRTLQPGEVIEDWLTVPDDEVWIMPDLVLRRVGTYEMSGFNYGIGSWYGGIISGSGDEPDRWAHLSGSLLMTVERVTDSAFKTRIQWTGSETVVQKTPEGSESDQMWKVRRGFELPIIRGKLKFTFLDVHTAGTHTGPPTAPEHTIDAGWWIQDAAQAQYTADYYGSRVTIPQPVLSSVALVPVPGLQIGDMVEVRDEHVTRLTIRGLVVEDSRSISADMGMQHAVAVRPIYVTRNGVSWEEWGSVVAGDGWNQWGSRQSGKTYQQWGANPLLGEAVL